MWLRAIAVRRSPEISFVILCLSQLQRHTRIECLTLAFCWCKLHTVTLQQLIARTGSGRAHPTLELTPKGELRPQLAHRQDYDSI